ncbi:phosphatase PAP2 family protein [Magnetospirillum sp. SS-4]|uniref:phosphatase PAP2 family protein n=1 Tax=Magnetospirillum sp. SS-4 TaxID=2681465 RepID=UPI00137FCB2A|nr:phosphatase PAP2 family protein [Magnetospirillum sp. SS-4]CAA7621947.1 putative Phosphoesterase, PA-phosphatase related [Magnetospirillum sp. SS-4]
MFPFDPWFSHLITASVGSRPLLDTLILWLADAHFLKGMPMVLGLWWCWYREPRDESRRFVVSLILGVTLAIVLSRGLQMSGPFNPRPLHNLALDLPLVRGVNVEGLCGLSSFPSDHAGVFAAFAFGWFRWSRRAGSLALAWALLAICAPRLYLGYHYLSDVLAGMMVGAFAVWLAFCPALAETFHRLARGAEAGAPSLFYPAFFAFTAQLAVMFNDVRNLGEVGLNGMIRLAGWM